MNTGEKCIQTVTGRISCDELGKTLIHEHVICSSAEFQLAFREKWLPAAAVAERAADCLRYVREKHGVRTIVDGTPPALGRDLELLRHVSELSGVNIIASTGFYHYASLSVGWLEPESLAGHFIEEIERGSIRPGILKCAVDAGGLQRHHERMLKCVALVQRQTGLPIFAHSCAGEKNGNAILDILLGCGVEARRIVVGHAADTCETEYVRGLLKRGCGLSIDRLYAGGTASKAHLLAGLIREGYLSQLFLSHDFICSNDIFFCGRGFPSEVNCGRVHANPHGLGVIFNELAPMLLADGVTREQIDRLLIENPANLWDHTRATQ